MFLSISVNWDIQLGHQNGADDEDDDVCRLVVGKRFDLFNQVQVSTQDILDFESRCEVSVMRIKNAAPASSLSDVFTEDAFGAVGNRDWLEDRCSAKYLVLLTPSANNCG